FVLSSSESLKACLQQFDCHFTWELLEEDADISEINERLNSQLKYLITENMYMVYNILAYIKHLQGDQTQAISNLDKAVSSSNGANCKLLVTYANFAWVYYHAKQYEESQTYIDKVNNIYNELKYLPGDKAKPSEIYGEHGWSLVQFCRKYYEKAIECFEKALEEAPDDPEWNTGYATVIYRLECFRDSKYQIYRSKSLQLLTRAVELNPKDSTLKALLALKLQDMKRGNEGIKYVEQALKQTPDLPYLLRYVAKFYRREGMPENALSVLKKALEFLPNSAFLYHQSGLCYRQMMHAKKRQAKKYNPNQRIYANEIEELIQKAILNFQKALEHKQSLSYAYIDLADMYTEADDYRKAEEIFQKALAIPYFLEVEKQQIMTAYRRFKDHCLRTDSEAADSGFDFDPIQLSDTSSSDVTCQHQSVVLRDLLCKGPPFYMETTAERGRL
ncbi:interferon-induced protein with tetratricopeptide repeats 5-like, partial [Pelodytes ibericus]